jgi:VWFA-related protein
MVIDFDEKVFLLQSLTDDKEELKRAIHSTYADGGTAIYDALHAAFRILNPQDGRKAIVLLTDGDDTNSQFSFQRILELARTSNVVIYTIGLGSGLRRGPLKDLARETGGRAFFPGDVKKLEEVYDLVAMELRSQYYLTYSSGNKEMDGSFRKITLKALRDGVEIRTRRGYYAVPQ